MLTHNSTVDRSSSPQMVNSNNVLLSVQSQLSQFVHCLFCFLFFLMAQLSSSELLEIHQKKLPSEYLQPCGI